MSIGLCVFIASGAIPWTLFLTNVDSTIASGITNRSSALQAAYQLAFLVITLSISISSGLFTGWIVKKFVPVESYFLDEELWEVPEMEIPYYFDVRGEVEHKALNASRLSILDVGKIVDERLGKGK